MCKSRAEGGQRCAAHTRPAYEAAEFGTPEWERAAVEYASTPTGADHVRFDRDERLNAGDLERWAALNTALRQGEAMREANREAADVIRQHAQEAEMEQARRIAGADRDAMYAQMHHHARHAAGDTSMYTTLLMEPAVAKEPEPTPQEAYASLFEERNRLMTRIGERERAIRETADAHEVDEMYAQVAAIDHQMAAMETWRPGHPDYTGGTASASMTDADADARFDRMLAEMTDASHARWVEEHGEPEIRNGWDGEGWYVDDHGVRYGTCDQCGNEVRKGHDCRECPDGIVKPSPRAEP